MLGTLTVAPGVEAARGLDTCPTSFWDPAASPELGCGGGWRLGALGDGMGRLGRRGPRRGLFAWVGVHIGVHQSPVRPREQGELHCGKGAARGWPLQWLGPPATPRAAVSAGSDGAVCWLGVQPGDNVGWWEGGRSNRGSGSRGHLWKAFVLNLQWEVPPLFRIQHPETPPAFPEICAMELFWGRGVTGPEGFSELIVRA